MASEKASCILQLDEHTPYPVCLKVLPPPPSTSWRRHWTQQGLLLSLPCQHCPALSCQLAISPRGQRGSCVASEQEEHLTLASTPCLPCSLPSTPADLMVTCTGLGWVRAVPYLGSYSF